MTSLLNRMSPSITNMIRLDHTHVETAFRQYESAASARVKKGIVDNVCLALEIHAQLEEEIFYPALREVADTEALRKAGPEHNEMRQLIGRLRAMAPSDPTYDDTFMELARIVMHHAAEEETQLLPAAERLLPNRLSEMGARMTRRRLELTAPRTGELAGSVARSMSTGTLIAAASALLAGGYLLTRRTHGERPWTQRMWQR
jgi:hemerythrin superfamily protein